MLFLTLISNAQVGVGTTTPAGALDITSSTNGLLLPRVSLTALNIATPVVNPAGGALVVGTLIWNTATAGVIPNNVVPGMYYWEGTRWISLAGSPGGLDWSLSGNTGTNPATNYVGTTDNVPLILRANSIERIRMGTAETVINEDAQNYDFRIEGTGESEMFFVDASTNHVHIRASSPFPTIDMFTSVGVANDYPINGYASGQGSAAVYGQHATDATGTNSNSGGAFDGSGIGFTTLPGLNIGAIGTAKDIGIAGTSTLASAAENTNTRYGGYFSNSMYSGSTNTIQAVAHLAGYNAGNYYGGYFAGGQDNTGSVPAPGGTVDYAWVGIKSGGTNYKILGNGTVSTIVKDKENKGRVLFASESPEVTFTDSGVGKLVNGVCTINIEDILAKNIIVNEKHPLKVFIQLEGDCNGVFVTDKSANGFTVKELKNGKSNISFSWQLIANRADDINTNGELISKFADVRFPIAPEKPEDLKQGVAKAASKK